MKKSEDNGAYLKRNKVILKTFLKNWKNYVVFFSSYMLSVAVIFIFLSVKHMLTPFQDGEFFVPIYGMGKIITDGLKVIAIMTVFLMIFAMKYYYMTRVKDYEIYKVMGMRRSLLNKLLGLEYAGSIVLALLGGFLAGNLFTFICKGVFQSLYFHGRKVQSPGVKTYVFTILICALIFFISFAVNDEIMVETNIINTAAGVDQREKRPGRRSMILLPLGIAVTGVGVFLYSGIRSAERLSYLIVFLTGIAVVFYYGSNILLESRRKNRPYYYSHLLQQNYFYYHFKTNINYIILLFFLQFFVLFYYPVQLLTNVPVTVGKDAYPYEFIWKMDQNDHEEKQLLEKLEGVPGVESTKIPAVAVTVPIGNNKANSSNDAFNQGQNIGIPESAYERFTGKNLALNEHEIHVVLQQGKGDPVHPLDYYGIFSTYLHFGPAYLGVNLTMVSDYFTNAFTVKRVEAKNIIGEFGGGNNENIVVFSDQIFEELNKIKNMEELVSFKIKRGDITDYHYNTPSVQGYVESAGYLNQLVLFRVPQDREERVNDLFRKQYISTEGEDSIYDSRIQHYYYSKEARDQRISEQVCHNIIYGILYCVFVFTELFVLFVKIVSEEQSIRKEKEFYHIMGMRDKESKKVIYRKLRIMFVVPLLSALAFGGIFTAAVLRLREFTTDEAVNFLVKDIILAGGFILFQFIIYYSMKHHINGKKD